MRHLKTKLLVIALLLCLSEKTVYGQSQTDTTCIKTEQLRKIVKDARKSKIQAEQIDNLNDRLYNDSLIILNDGIIIDNQKEEIEGLKKAHKGERVKAVIYKCTTSIFAMLWFVAIIRD